jgi:hypothetical protein
VEASPRTGQRPGKIVADIALVGPVIFLFQPQTFGVFFGYLGMIELDIYL